MSSQKKTINRRTLMKSGLAAAATMVAPNADASQWHANIRPKAKGETKIVFLGGDYLHNGLTQEFSLRSTFYSKYPDYRFIATSDARYVTADLLQDADLFIIVRWGGPINVFCPDVLIEDRPSKLDGFMSDELEELIVDNVENRGMGLMALHCSCWNPESEAFTRLMGIKANMHGPVQNVKFHSFDRNHPITKGIDDFELNLDENFGVELTDPAATSLFMTTGVKDKRKEIAGWCVEKGKGRVVGIVAGHTWEAWWNTTIREMHWRGAHWAMNREITPCVLPENGNVMPWADLGY